MNAIRKMFLNPKTGDTIFYIAFGLCLVFGILGVSLYSVYIQGLPYKIAVVFYVCLLILREVVMQLRSYNLRTVCCALVFFLLFIVAWVRGPGVIAKTVACMILFAYCARNMDLQKMARLAVWVSAITVAFVILSSYIGVIDNVVSVSAGGRMRAYLGFRYSLYAPALLFNITALAIYVRQRNIKWMELAVLVLANIWVYTQTDSRLSFYLAIAMLVIAALLKARPHLLKGIPALRRVICWIMILSFILCFAVSLVVTVNYNANISWLYDLNRVLENRLLLGKLSLQEYGIHWFGADIEWIGNGLNSFGEAVIGLYNYVDCFYIKILQRYGIIFTVLWIALSTITQYFAYKNHDYFLMIMLTFCAGRCVIDDLALYVYYNFFWLAFSIPVRSFERGDCLKRGQHFNRAKNSLQPD